MSFARFIYAETGAAQYGPHPLPKLDKLGWAEATWPKFTAYPIPTGKMSLIKGKGISITPGNSILSGANIAAVLDEISTALPNTYNTYWTPPGQEFNGSLWPRQYTNAQPSGDPKTPLLVFGKMGPSSQPTEAPPKPFNAWKRVESWVWQDTSPGFWRPVDKWLPYNWGGKTEQLGDGNLVITNYDALGNPTKYLTVTDPQTGEQSSIQIDAKITDYKAAITKALEAARRQRASDEEKWKLQHPDQTPPQTGAELPAWIILLGVGVAAWLLLSNPKKKGPA